MTERSRSAISAVAAGAVLGAVVVLLWKQSAARRSTPVAPLRPAPRSPVPPEPPVPPVAVEAEDAGPSVIMKAELERLAGLAVSHGADDPALDVFLAFVAALDPAPDAGTLEPAAQRIGTPRLAEALNRPGEPGLGARRLLAAAPQAIEDVSETVAEERPAEAGRRLPELVEALLQAIRGALSALF